MGRLTRLTGGTVTASEGGRGKRLGVLVLAGVALLVVVRLLTRGGADTDDGGIDTISTEDDGPETVSIGSEDGDEDEESEASEESAADEEEDATGSDDDGGSGISVQAIDRRDVDLFDVIAIVGEALRAAREEYDRRAA